jgi:hypothetical protein
MLWPGSLSTACWVRCCYCWRVQLRARAFLLASVFVALWGGVASRAAAHPLDVGALQVALNGERLTASLDMSVPMAERLLAPDGGIGALASDALARLPAETLLSGPVTLAGKACSPSVIGSSREGDRLVVTVAGPCSGSGELRWSFPFIERMPFTFRLLGRVTTAASDRELILGSGHTELAVAVASDPGSEPRNFLQFVAMGMQHIGATPDQWHGPSGWHWPDGIDHILFLLALLLAGVALVPVLETVTGFTLGHSVSLSLATLGVLRPPSRLIESAIALSIAYVAAEDLWIRETARPRWQVASVFGLVHGFGFARALSDLHLPRGRLAGALLGFNLGVEIGQLIIVLLAAPLLYVLFRAPVFRRWGQPACALAILGCALVWFVQRAFG